MLMWNGKKKLTYTLRDYQNIYGNDTISKIMILVKKLNVHFLTKND